MPSMSTMLSLTLAIFLKFKVSVECPDLRPTISIPTLDDGGKEIGQRVVW